MLGVTFAALAAWSWGRWTDPLIDFGFELYVPWRIGEGEALYRDIAYRNGPLSAYWNALLFAAFGVSLRTLVLANLATLALITALLFGSIERSLSRLGALVGCAAFLAICGFSQYGTVGNYNFVTPYQHGQTHGLALGLALVALLAGAAPTGGLGRWIGAGGVLGLLVLTKVELSLPAFAVAGCAAALEWRRCGKAANRHLTAMAGAALVPPLAALGLLSLAMPAGAAWQGVLGNVPYLAQALFEDPFYRSTAGLDAPGASLLAIAAACAVIAAIGLLLRLCDERARPVVASRGGLLAAAVVLGGAAGSLVPLPWDAAARALPVAMALAVARWAPAAGGGGPVLCRKELCLGGLGSVAASPSPQRGRGCCSRSLRCCSSPSWASPPRCSTTALRWRRPPSPWGPPARSTRGAVRSLAACRSRWSQPSRAPCSRPLTPSIGSRTTRLAAGRIASSSLARRRALAACWSSAC